MVKKQLSFQISGLGKSYSIRASGEARTFRDLLSGVFNPLKKKEEKKEFWALKDINLEFVAGEVVGIVGMNGAGKSTLLKILSRVTEPTTGQVKIRGKVASLLEVGTGFHPELSGRENIFLNGSILGMSRWEILEVFDRIVDFSEISEFLDIPVKRYSSGMYMRLAFSVAAHLRSDILVVDEVLAVGDLQFQKRCLSRMEESTKEQGKTVLFVSHHLQAVERLCKRLVVLDHGRVKYEGETPDGIKYYLNLVEERTKITVSHERPTTGSGELRIQNFWIEDINGKVIISPQSGDEVFFCFSYERHAEKSPSFVAVEFTLSKGYDPLILFSSSYVGQTFSDLPKNGVFRCRISNLPLVIGRYFIHAAFKTAIRVIDEPQMFIGLFDVISGDFYKAGITPHERSGPILIHTKFELNSL